MRILCLFLSACGVQTLDAGIEVHVSATVDGEAALSVSAVELRECPAAARHSASSPTRIGVPHVVSGSVELGHLEPPPGSYCSLVFFVAPADDDAENAGDLVGYSVAVGGTRFGGSTTIEIPLGPLKLTGSGEHELRVAFSSSAWLAGVDATKLGDLAEQTRVLANIATSGALQP